MTNLPANKNMYKYDQESFYKYTFVMKLPMSIKKEIVMKSHKKRYSLKTVFNINQYYLFFCLITF